MRSRAWWWSGLGAAVLLGATGCGSSEGPPAESSVASGGPDASGQSSPGSEPLGSGSDTPEVDPPAAPAWKSLGRKDTFYVALGDDQNLVVAYVSPSGHYCVDNRASVGLLDDPTDPGSVSDPDALWKFALAHPDRDSSWMTTGAGCTGVYEDGELVPTTLDDEGVIRGGSSTGNEWTLELVPSSDGMTKTTLTSTSPESATVGDVLNFVALKHS